MSRCAFLFPGQGAQSVGMGRDLAEHFPECRRMLERAEDHLRRPLAKLMFSGPADELDNDFNAQLAVYTVSCMAAEVLARRGLGAAAMAPYSSGLYAAAFAAGAIDFETGLTLMCEADRCIREEDVEGGMGVVLGLAPEKVEELCAGVEGVVEASIINTRHQTAVSGTKDAINALFRLANDAEALKTGHLGATAPYHCSLLRGADKRMAEVMRRTPVTRSPRTPVYSYIDAAPITQASRLTDFFSNQLSNRVHWVAIVEALVDSGLGPMVEIGPGRMLSRATRWIHRRSELFHTETSADMLETIEAMEKMRDA